MTKDTTEPPVITREQVAAVREAIRQFETVMDTMTRAAQRAAQTMDNFIALFTGKTYKRTHEIMRAQLRLMLAGPHELIWTNDWQSAECQAWIHDMCPQMTRTTAVECNCTCHGGHLK